METAWCHWCWSNNTHSSRSLSPSLPPLSISKWCRIEDQQCALVFGCLWARSRHRLARTTPSQSSPTFLCSRPAFLCMFARTSLTFFFQCHSMPNEIIVNVYRMYTIPNNKPTHCVWLWHTHSYRRTKYRNPNRNRTQMISRLLLFLWACSYV